MSTCGQQYCCGFRENIVNAVAGDDSKNVISLHFLICRADWIIRSDQGRSARCTRALHGLHASVVMLLHSTFILQNDWLRTSLIAHLDSVDMTVNIEH